MKIFGLFVAFALICVALSQRAQGVVPPPPGGYPNFTTAAGDHALQALTSGVGNTALGTFSLFSATTGSFNTAVGAGSLDLNTADSNTATGAAALLFNTTGTENTANGTAALEFNETGSNNTATGAFALFNNTTGMDNTATGVNALADNVAGFGNIAIGNNSMANNVGGSLNTVVGYSSGGNLVNGIGNIYIGAIVAPSADESGTIRIADNALPISGTNSHVFIAGIGGSTVGAANTPVVINAVGQLGTLPSSARFKKDILSMDKTSEAIYSLRPVTFHYKGDETNTACSGLIAEEVAKVDPSLILLDKEGKPQTVRYEQINAMLLNEFLKEHRKMEQQHKQFETALARQQQQIEELTAGLHKVSAQLAAASPSGGGLEASKPAPQVVNNP
jgi:hypothetical protein